MKNFLLFFMMIYLIIFQKNIETKSANHIIFYISLSIIFSFISAFTTFFYPKQNSSDLYKASEKLKSGDLNKLEFKVKFGEADIFDKLSLFCINFTLLVLFLPLLVWITTFLVNYLYS